MKNLWVELKDELIEFCNQFIDDLEAKLDKLGATPYRLNFHIWTDSTENDRRGRIAFYAWWETDIDSVGLMAQFTKIRLPYQEARDLSAECITYINQVYPERSKRTKFLEPRDVMSMMTNHIPDEYWTDLQITND